MNKPFSFEFFPPKTDKGRDNLQSVYQTLADTQPEYFSVTYGAGGSTKDRTLDIVLELKQAGLNVAPHLSIGADGKEEISRLLSIYKEQGINRIVALRGDLPENHNPSDYQYYAKDLIEHIRETTGDHFTIEVACYPEVHPDSPSFEHDIKFFKEKVDSGANSAITQYFYNIDSYFYFLDACEKNNIKIPIVPGIMPITNFSNLVKFSDASGADIPRWLRKRLESYGDDIESIKSFGVDFVSQFSEKLLEGGAPSLHFYSMNQAEPVINILKNIK